MTKRQSEWLWKQRPFAPRQRGTFSRGLRQRPLPPATAGLSVGDSGRGSFIFDGPSTSVAELWSYETKSWIYITAVLKLIQNLYATVPEGDHLLGVGAWELVKLRSHNTLSNIERNWVSISQNAWRWDSRAVLICCCHNNATWQPGNLGGKQQ